MASQKLKNASVLLRPRELAAAMYFMRNQKVLSTREHLALTADAMLNASRHSPDGGYSMAYSLYLGWAPGYVETTGYLVPSALDIDKAIDRPDLKKDALRQGEWLLHHQRSDGSFPDASRMQSTVFDTGQVLMGLQRLYAETSDERYKAAGLRACDWLAGELEAASRVDGNCATVPVPTYNTRSAAALIDFATAYGEPRHVEVGRAFLNWCAAQKLPGGLFRHSPLGGDRDFLLHTSIYVLEGFLHAHTVLGEQRWLDVAIEGAEPFKRSNGEREVVLYSYYDADMNPTTRERCLTGLSQWAGVCLRLFELTGDTGYRDCASNSLFYVKSKQIQWPGQLRGALPGSVPFWGRYLRLAFPNWNLKFFADALLKWQALGLDSQCQQEVFVRGSHDVRAKLVGWSDHASSMSAFDTQILKRFEAIFADHGDAVKRPLDILDLGCGEGRYMAWFKSARPEWRISGVDPMPPSSSNLAITKGSATAIPLPDASIDGIYASIALQHVGDISAAIVEAKRVLRPGGVLVVFDRNPVSLRGLLKPWHELRGRWLYEWDAPFRERWYTPRRWRSILQGAGFRPLTSRSMTHWAGGGLRGKLPVNRFVLIAGRKPG